MAPDEGNGSPGRRAVEIAAIGKLSPHYLNRPAMIDHPMIGNRHPAPGSCRESRFAGVLRVQDAR
jgi:hypothetical protein